MPTRVNMHEAKSDLSRLVAEAQRGEEVIIMRAGKPVARLVPIHEERIPGLAQYRIHVGPDFDASLPDELLDALDGR